MQILARLPLDLSSQLPLPAQQLPLTPPSLAGTALAGPALHGPSPARSPPPPARLVPAVSEHEWPGSSPVSFLRLTATRPIAGSGALGAVPFNSGVTVKRVRRGGSARAALRDALVFLFARRVSPAAPPCRRSWRRRRPWRRSRPRSWRSWAPAGSLPRRSQPPASWPRPARARHIFLRAGEGAAPLAPPPPAAASAGPPCPRRPDGGRAGPAHSAERLSGRAAAGVGGFRGKSPE